MNKKTYLFVLLALIAGGAAGYTGSLLAVHSTDIDEKQADSGVTIRPRFGDVRSLSAFPQKSSARPSGAEMAKLDENLQRYSRMSTEELWNELEILEKQTERNTYAPNTMREICMSCILNKLGQESPRQTLAMMKNEKPILRDYQYSILKIWGKKNPEAAMAYCRENMENDQENSRGWKGTYITLLSESSPEKAVDYLLTLSPEECTEYGEDVLIQIAGKTPEKMTEIMEKLAPAMKRHKWIDGYIAAQWAQADCNAAEQWVNTLPEKSRSEIMARVVGVLPPEEALKKLGTLDEKGKMEALSWLGRTLSEESQVKALDMVLNNMTEEQSVKAFERGLSFVNLRDSEIRTYVEKMPAGTVKDAILEKMVQHQSYSGAENAFFNTGMEDIFSLIDQMSPSSKKEETVDEALNRWVDREPQKVKSWVERSHLPDEKKIQFFEECDRVIKSGKEGK